MPHAAGEMQVHATSTAATRPQRPTPPRPATQGVPVPKGILSEPARHGLRSPSRHEEPAESARRSPPRPRAVAPLGSSLGRAGLGSAGADEGRLGLPALDGVSFTPAGLLFPYYVGVVAAMTDSGLLGESTRLGGSSAGAIIAVLACSGLSADQSMEIHNKLLADVRENGTVGRLGTVLRRMLTEYLPEDIAERATGRVTIGMTDFNGFRELPFRQVLVQSFTSKEDVIDAVCASCHIPFYLGPSVGIPFRGQELSDGALMAFLPEPWQLEDDVWQPADDGTRRLVGVSAVPATSLGVEGYGRGIDISPDVKENQRYGFWELTRMGLLPYPEATGRGLFQDGYEDTMLWARKDNWLSVKLQQQEYSEVSQQLNVVYY